MSFWDGILEVESRLDDTSYYDLLGVTPTSSADRIAARYYELADKLHPDRHTRGADADRRNALSRVHARLTEAKHVLTSPSLRARYDRELGQGERHPDLDAASRPAAIGSATHPSHPVARKLYTDAQRMLDAGDMSRARSTLELAKHYEPESTAITQALARARGETETGSTETPQTASDNVAVSEILDRFAAEAPREKPTPAEPAVAKQPPPVPRPPAIPPTPGGQAEPKVRQRHGRHRATIQVRLKFSSPEKLRMVYSQNISQGGMFLATNKPATLGTRLKLTLVAPSGESIALRGVVAHSSLPNETERPGMGIKFEPFDSSTESMLRRLVGEAAKPATPMAEIALDNLVGELVRLRSVKPHEVLGVAADANTRIAGEAYAELARKYHPARNKTTNPVQTELLREVFEVIRIAYEQFSAG